MLSLYTDQRVYIVMWFVRLSISNSINLSRTLDLVTVWQMEYFTWVLVTETYVHDITSIFFSQRQEHNPIVIFLSSVIFFHGIWHITVIETVCYFCFPLSNFTMEMRRKLFPLKAITTNNLWEGNTCFQTTAAVGDLSHSHLLGKQPRLLSNRTVIQCRWNSFLDRKVYSVNINQGLDRACLGAVNSFFFWKHCFGPCVVFSLNWHSCGFNPKEATDCTAGVRHMEMDLRSACKTFKLSTLKSQTLFFSFWLFFQRFACMRTSSHSSFFAKWCF